MSELQIIDSAKYRSKNKVVSKKSVVSSSESLEANLQKSLDKNRLECMYVNARSIVNKHKELELYVKQESIDIIGISETLLNESIADSEMNLDGYTLFRRDRNDELKKRGAGW